MLFQPHRCLSELVLSKHLRFMLVTITKWGLHINCPMSGAGNTSHSGEWLEGLQVVSLTANLQEVVTAGQMFGGTDAEGKQETEGLLARSTSMLLHGLRTKSIVIKAESRN